MKKNIAVVGAGYWGKNLVRVFYELGALNTICDVDKELGLGLDCVVDNDKDGEEWFGYKVIDMDEFSKSNNSVLILASFNEDEIEVFCKEQEKVKVVALRE